LVHSHRSDLRVLEHSLYILVQLVDSRHLLESLLDNRRILGSLTLFLQELDQGDKMSWYCIEELHVAFIDFLLLAHFLAFNDELSALGC
jgi:hypothetical protein